MIFHKRGAATAVNKKTKQPVKPAGLGTGPLEIAPDDDPRLALADWMSSKDNPFFARALVNRYWKHFFSRGIVEPEDDMRETNPPSNPELLDALAKHFVESGYDLKELVRDICRSQHLPAQRRAERVQQGRPAELLALLPEAAQGRSAARRGQSSDAHAEQLRRPARRARARSSCPTTASTPARTSSPSSAGRNPPAPASASAPRRPASRRPAPAEREGHPGQARRRHQAPPPSSPPTRAATRRSSASSTSPPTRASPTRAKLALASAICKSRARPPTASRSTP